LFKATKKNTNARIIIVWILILIFIISIFPSSSLQAAHVYAQSAPACPSYLTLRGAEDGGAPKTLNMYVTPNIVDLGYNRGITPIFSPLGTPDYNSSIAYPPVASNNYTVWTINIRPGLNWSDGTPITSADILATYSSKFAFNASYDFTGDHNEVKSEVALNSTAVQFNLTKSDDGFPTVIGEQVLTSVAPAEVINANASTPTDNLFDTPSSGPFYSVNYQPGDTTMKMPRNPYYSPAPTPCELDLSFPESSSTIASLLIGGSIDFGRLDAVSAKLIENISNLHVWAEPGNGPIQLNYNITDYPLNMTAFRQALVFGTNESAISEQALNGFGTTAYKAEGDVPSQFTNIYSPNQMQYSFNQSKSLALLSSIGIAKGSDGKLRYSNGTQVTLTLWSSNDYSSITAAGIIDTDLTQLGLNIVLHSCDISCMFGFSSLEGGTMYLTLNGAALYSSPLFDALPCWDVYCVPALANINYMYPPNIDAQYNGNQSIIKSTTDPVQDHQAITNIQALGAQYLPLIPLSYAQELWGYSTARWTNWTPYPQAWMNWGAQDEMSWYSYLRPVGSGTVSSNTSASSSSSALGSTTSQSSTVAPPSSSSSVVTTATAPATSTTSTSNASNSILLLGVVVVIVVILAASAAMLMRRRKPKA
jgi:peptide/nickel transport system substrate-binding protein